MVRILLAALVAALLLPVTPAAAAPQRVLPCSRGLVALTFDDGPLDTVTPRLVRLLKRLEVPATFFMVGNRVEAHPELVRLVNRSGFAIGNHTWAHADLTEQTPAEVRHALAATERALIDAGVQPTDLARPPYGAVNDRVRRLIGREDLVPVLWTVDSLDWTGLSPKQIEERVVAGVRPHRTNVVLLHDGVTNSPATLKALPELVTRLQKRGYCFADLGAYGKPLPPVPVVTVRPRRTEVGERSRVRLYIRLDRPTTRATRVYTHAGTTLIPAGRVTAQTSFTLRGDRTDERPQELTVYPGVVIRVLDNDPAPAPSLEDVAVDASPLLPTPVTITVRLDRMSDRPTLVVVRTPLGPVEVVVPAFSKHATGTLTVPVGRSDQRVREVGLRADGAAATLTIRPPEQTWLAAARGVVAQLRWPSVTVTEVF